MRQTSLCVVVQSYPSLTGATKLPFVRELARAFVRSGCGCRVVHPVSVPKVLHRLSEFPVRQMEAVDGTDHLEVRRPRFIGLGLRAKLGRLGRVNPSRVTFRQYRSAVTRAVGESRADFVYGHFLYMAGAAAVGAGRSLGMPAFPGVGEGEFWTLEYFGEKAARRDLDSAAGFVVNSSAGRDALCRTLGMKERAAGVFPNGVDLGRFRPFSRAQARQDLGLPTGKVLVGAVGSFLFKKGIARVAEAIDGLEGVQGVFAGAGPEAPTGANVAFCGQLSHEKIPVLLSACDVFVLPTLVEGCCNAIIEAMACGLPVISSDRPFNDDLLTEEMSIRVDPLDVPAIRAAIVTLRDDPERRQHMAEAALERSKRFDINDRAARILDFMAEKGAEWRERRASLGRGPGLKWRR